MSAQGKEMFVLFGFDMEPDIGSWTRIYHGVKEGTPRILDVLKKRGVKATFFFTAEAAVKNTEVLKMVKRNSHEIGCHGYEHESFGPELFETPMVGNLPKWEIYGRIAKATEIIKRIAGSRPVAFRGARLFGSNEMMKALEKLGYRVDSTYPSYYYEKHILPFHPSVNNWTRSGRMNILEVPLFADLTAKSKDPLRRDRDQWPVLRLKGAEAIIDMVLRFVKSHKGPYVFSFYLHPWEFVKMPKVIKYPEVKIELKEFLWKNSGRFAVNELSRLIKMIKEIGGEILTMADLHKIWEEKYCPRHSKVK